jgi:hypothetical protein
MKPEQKALEYLISKKWYFDDEKMAAKDLKRAFKNSGRNHLVNAINILLKNTDWSFYNINDLKTLDNARKIYRKYLAKTQWLPYDVKKSSGKLIRKSYENK